MNSRELLCRLEGIANHLDQIANPPFKARIGELKTEVRSVRNTARELIQEFEGGAFS